MNNVYVFGNNDLTDRKPTIFKVNGQKTEVNSGEFKLFPVKIGEEIKINKGGFTGMTLWIKGMENKESTFLSFSGFGINGLIYNSYGGTGISFNTGSIYSFNPNLGLLLLKIFKETN